MKSRRFLTTLLACVLLLGCFSIPTSAADIPAAAAEASRGEAVVLRATGRLNHSLPANLITPITQALPFLAGDIISFDCSYTPKSASLDFGYIDANNKFYYLNCTSGSIDKSIELDTTGRYTLAIRNNESYAVTVTGTVKY